MWPSRRASSSTRCSVGADWLLIAGAGIVGLCFGSFLNVCILRLPHDQSLLKPPSTCPQCKRRIAWRDNIPVVSWLLLKGKCRHCHKPISRQYPLIEALVGLLWASSVLWFGPTLHGLAGAVLGAATGLALLYAVAVVGKWVFKEEAMGGGDIKMMAMVGSFVGWKGVLLTIFAGALLGTMIFVPLSFKKKKLVPFGVFLAVGAAVTFLFRDTVIDWYLRFIRGG